MKVVSLVRTKDEVALMTSVMPGGIGWEKYIDDFGGNCLKSCPYFRRCGEGNGTGPNLVCSSAWRNAELSSTVFNVLSHVLSNFSHYNRGDLVSGTYDRIAKAFYRRLTASDDETYPEGEPRLRWHAFAERHSKAARDKKRRALLAGALQCKACNVDFYAKLGAQATRVVECHHLLPLANGPRATKSKELVLLCATCHRIAHTRPQPLTIREIRKKLG